MPLDYALATSHVRTKAATSPGTFDPDPDVANPAVELPEPETTRLGGDPATALAWRLPNRETAAVKLKVTFRKGDGAEVAGTYKAYGFVVVPWPSRRRGRERGRGTGCSCWRGRGRSCVCTRAT